MKTILFAFVVLGSNAAFADSITLSTGESTTVAGMTVTCSELPKCSVRVTGAPYTVYIEDSPMIDAKTMDEAIAGVQKLRNARLCQ